MVVIAGLQQLWVGKNYAGLTQTLWIHLTSIHILLADEVVKTVPSRVTTADLERLSLRGVRTGRPDPAQPPLSLPAPVEDRRQSWLSAPLTATASSLSAVSNWRCAPVSPGLG